MESHKFLICIVMISAILVSCNSSERLNNDKPAIFPSDCKIKPQEDYPLSLQYDGDFEKIEWESTKGTVLSIGDGHLVIYTAPLEAGKVIISATITTKTGKIRATPLSCIISNDGVSVSTSEPTASPPTFSTETETPTPKQDKYVVYVSTTIVYLRAGPHDLHAKVSEYYHNGDEMTIVGKNQYSTWFLVVTTRNEKGWIYKGWINLENINIDEIPIEKNLPAPPSTPVPTPKDRKPGNSTPGGPTDTPGGPTDTPGPTNPPPISS
jgi:hypothetical protein